MLTIRGLDSQTTMTYNSAIQTLALVSLLLGVWALWQAIKRTF